MGPVPWSTDRLWAEAQAALRSSLAQNKARLAPARRHAGAIAHYLDCLADLFDQLAPSTCEVCRDPCCGHAKVWLNFQDLLFIQLLGVTPPPHQLRRNLYEPCRFLGPQGCLLPYLSRPWICTWYFCPDLHRSIKRDIPGGGMQTAVWARRIKSLRNAMETAYLNALGFSVAG